MWFGDAVMSNVLHAKLTKSYFLSHWNANCNISFLPKAIMNSLMDLFYQHGLIFSLSYYAALESAVTAAVVLQRIFLLIPKQ